MVVKPNFFKPIISANFVQKIFLLLAVLFLHFKDSFQINKCTDPTATFYDGYLEPFIYYANFDKNLNSFIRIRNPFEGI